MGIEQVLEKQQNALMSLPGVVGVGIGESEAKPIIIIMVSDLTPELRRMIPDKLDGFDVKVDVVGEIRAF